MGSSGAPRLAREPRRATRAPSNLLAVVLLRSPCKRLDRERNDASCSRHAVAPDGAKIVRLCVDPSQSCERSPTHRYDLPACIRERHPIYEQPRDERNDPQRFAQSLRGGSKGRLEPTRATSRVHQRQSPYVVDAVAVYGGATLRLVIAAPRSCPR